MVHVAVLICAVFLGVLAYRYDLYEKEPWHLLLLAVFLGGSGMWLVGFLEERLIAGVTQFQSVAGEAFVAATAEEIARLLIVIAIALSFRRHFNDPIDGLIYGSFVGLGAGVLESWYYTSFAEPSISIFGREFVRLALHLMLGGVVGFAIGLTRFRLGHWITILGGCFAVAWVIHYCWDRFVGIPAQMGQSYATERLVAVVLMIAGMIAFGTAVSWGSHWSRLMHAPHLDQRLWGWPFRRGTETETKEEPDN